MTGRDRSHCLPSLSRVWQHVKLSDVSLGTRPRYSLVVDDDVKKPTNQTNNWKIAFSTPFLRSYKLFCGGPCLLYQPCDCINALRTVMVLFFLCLVEGCLNKTLP